MNFKISQKYLHNPLQYNYLQYSLTNYLIYELDQ